MNFKILIKTLKQNEGKTCKYKELIQVLKKEKQMDKKEKTHHRDYSFESEVYDTLVELADFNLLKLSDNKIMIKKPFLVESTVTVSSTGSAFTTGFNKDIIIYPENRNQARNYDKVLLEISSKKKNRYEGNIVKILNLFQNKFFAKVIEKKTNGYLIFLPDTPDSSFGILQTKWELEKNSYIIVKPADTFLKSGIPLSVLKSLNFSDKTINDKASVRNLEVFHHIEICDSNTLASDIKRIALKYSLPEKYPESVVPSRKKLKEKAAKEFKNKLRKNLSTLYTITIDGDDAKDFDDAISLEKTLNGYTAYVHIADVSFYTEKNNPLDQEALSRGNSYYLINTVIPMLPFVLSEDYCSLKPKTKRLAFTCEMKINNQGDIESFHFYKSIIFINKRFTYKEAEKDLSRKNSSIKPFWNIAEILLNKRLSHGRIDLNIPEQEPVTDAHGRMTAVLHKERLKSHRLIEEFMLSANTCAAAFADENKIPILHRIHEPIPSENLQKINEFLSLFGHKIILSSTSEYEIKKALKKVEGSTEESVFNYLLLRCFCKAEYSKESLGHWALGFNKYTHFTSPIRRFSDLVVHRQLSDFLEHKPFSYKEIELKSVAKEINRLEKLAMEAERTTIKLMSVRFFQGKEGAEFKAYFTGFNSYGLFIQLQDPQLEGFIPAESVSRKRELTSLDDFRVVLDKFQKVIALGASLSVVLEKADWDNMRLVFKVNKIL
ncbi:MAG: ribonuclease R [Spirochaetia bacterium]|nr:ribonuclease R [Spirochaetia bacterium]